MEAVQRLPRWKRFALLALVSPTLLAALVSLGFYANLHRTAQAMSGTSLPKLPALTKTQRLLVIAPHCDDETLGAGGLIAQARQSGIPVQVVFLTNGDAFPAACALVTRRLPTRATDYVHLGEIRQKEALKALAALGVDAGSVTFLGYPDRGLNALWEDHWQPSAPYRSPYTNRTSTPRGAYCGAALVTDIKRVLEQFRPTDVFVTHPADDHMDHSIAASFTEAALAGSPRKNILLHYYIVHRGDWPLPQGYSPQLNLVPPSGFALADTHWRSLTLRSETQKAKKRALNQYPSQLELCGRQLRSFLRGNEIFGAIFEPRIETSHVAKVRDAQGDDVVRFANPATDLTALSAQIENESLRVTLQLRGAAAPGVRYGLRLRTASGVYLARTLQSPRLTQTGKRELTYTFPLAPLRLGESGTLSTLWLSAETGMTTRYIVDRTGYRRFSLRNP